MNTTLPDLALFAIAASAHACVMNIILATGGPMARQVLRAMLGGL